MSSRGPNPTEESSGLFGLSYLGWGIALVLAIVVYFLLGSFVWAGGALIAVWVGGALVGLPMLSANSSH